MKNKKGITLVALIITIIVMLILIAVAVTLLINSGIIPTAKSAVTSYKAAQTSDEHAGETAQFTVGDKAYNSVSEFREEINNAAAGVHPTEVLPEEIDYSTLSTVTGLSNSSLTIDGAYLLTATVSTGDDPSNVVWTSDNHEIATVTNEGVVLCGTKTSQEASGATATITCIGKNNTSATCVVTSTAKRVTSVKGAGAPIVPTGFIAIDTADAKWTTGTAELGKGLVIMDERGNEFVWIPVANVIYNSTYSEHLPTGYETASKIVVNGETPYNYTPMAIDVTATSNQDGTYHSGDTYKGLAYQYNLPSGGAYLLYASAENLQGTDSEPERLTTYDGKAYSGSIINDNYDNQRKTIGTANTTPYLKIVTDILGSTDGYVNSSTGAYSNSVFLETMQSDYNNMVQSVATKGGFYIGRYESSLLNGKTRELAGAISMKSNNAESARWYGLYARQKKFAVDNGYTTISSHMIWRSQYNAMVNWMFENDIDIRDEAVRTDGKTRNITEITGQMGSTDKLNNIYDLLGNSREWTMGASGSNCRSALGGLQTGNLSVNYCANEYPYHATNQFGSRVVIY